MLEISHKVPVNGPGQTELTRAQVWRGLVMKAENAVLFVPGMDRCEVLERGEGWLLREAQFQGNVIRERVTFEPERRVHFDQIEGAEGWIDNLIEEAPDGSLELRFVFGVPPSEEPRARDLEPVYRKALENTMATVRRMVAEGKLGPR
jgi:hypothetical protein